MMDQFVRHVAMVTIWMERQAFACLVCIPVGIVHPLLLIVIVASLIPLSTLMESVLACLARLFYLIVLHVIV